MGTQGSVPVLRPALVVPVLAVVLVLAGCGIDEDVVAREAASARPPGSTTTTTAAPRPPIVSGFTIEDVPAGYEAVVEGMGEDEATTDHRPVTVLAPGGEPVGTGVVFVEPAPEGSDDTFVAGTDDEPWARLVADDVQVWGLEADEEDLLAVASAAEPPAADGLAPTVAEPPGGLEVVGSIARDGVVALAAGVPGTDDGAVPGPPSAPAAVYRCTDCDGSLVVMALPAGSLDPDAVVTETRTPRRTADEPRDSLVEDTFRSEDVTWRGVVVATADPATGALVRRIAAVDTGRAVLLLVARGADALTAAELVDVAESVAVR